MTATLRRTTASVAALALFCAATSAAAQDEKRHDGTSSSSHVAVSIKLAPPPSRDCQATMSTRYEQRNTVARIESTIEIADCVACSGDYTIVLRVRDESGETKSLEFAGSWQRADGAPVKVTADYPIGANVDLLGARSRGLRCVCADAAPAAQDRGSSPNADTAPRVNAAPSKE